MSDSRIRYTAWMNQQQTRPINSVDWGFVIWQAAEASRDADVAQAVRRCVEIVAKWEYYGNYQSNAIRAEFPEAFK